MTLDKVLQRIHIQIKDLAPVLELFIDDTIQPTVQDCEKLQMQLNLLQENLAIYKFCKTEKEISPNFPIHAKVSEKETSTTNPGIQVEVVPEPAEKPPVIEEKKNPAPSASKPHLTVGINDKFRFINELFSHNDSEYSIAVQQLNNLTSWHETEVYLNSLKGVYDWKDNNEVVRHFFSLVKKRFE